MEIKIKVKSGSSKNLVEKKGEGYIVYVRERAIDNKANKAVLKLLKKYFGKPVRIIKGFKNREKIISFI